MGIMVFATNSTHLEVDDKDVPNGYVFVQTSPPDTPLSVDFTLRKRTVTLIVEGIEVKVPLWFEVAVENNS